MVSKKTLLLWLAKKAAREQQLGDDKDRAYQRGAAEHYARADAMRELARELEQDEFAA